MNLVATAYDNIRLTRLKVNIAQEEVVRLDAGPRRDEAVMRVVTSTEDLVRAVQDFADLGFEEDVAALLLQIRNVDRRAV